MSVSIPIVKCLACSSDTLETVLDLGNQPLANNFLDVERDQELYPLALNYCHGCTHLQLTHNVRRDVLFDNYLYVSGTSSTLRDDFQEFASLMNDRFGAKKILDIACNDGSQLDQFKKLGWQTIGIDPARNLLELSIQNHIVICDYLRPEHANFIKTDVAVAQNVLAHSDNPKLLIESALNISEVLFAQTSQALMIQNGEFDTIYHEHLSFFSQQSIQALTRRAGKVLNDISFRKIHGTSFLMEISNSGIEFAIPKGPSAEEARNFGKRSRNTIEVLDDILEKERASGATIIGYGASAKGMTVINALNSSFDFFIDDSPLKQGRFTPGKNVPIKDSKFLSEISAPVTFVMTAWNFEDEIRARISQFYKGKAKFVKYFPQISVE